MAEAVPKKKPKVNMARAWSEARALMWKHRRSLAIGLALMLVSRLAGLVLPYSSKFLIDNVLTNRQLDLLVPLALAVGAATVVQAITSFALSQIVSIAAQRAISELDRRQVGGRSLTVNEARPMEPRSGGGFGGSGGGNGRQRREPRW